MLVLFDFLDKSESLKVGYDDFSGFIAIKPLIFSAELVYFSVIVQNTDYFKIVAQTDLEDVFVRLMQGASR